VPPISCSEMGSNTMTLARSISIQRDKERLSKRLLQRLRDLGVNLEVKAA